MSSTLQNGVELSAAEKRALLVDLLREKAARSQTAPTSFAQQRLWFLSRLEPDSPAYNIPRPLRITGELDLPVLQQTLNAILARHAVLRGSFDLVEGQPVQIIVPRLEIDIPVIDLSTLDANEREAEVSRLAIADAERPFDLSKAPLLRVSLLRLAPREHVLFLTMHHIISDGWSIGILVQEMAAIYRAISAGEPAGLPELPIQYADFARWQREWLQGEVLDEHLGYWKQQLSGAPAVLDLPIARPRPAMQTMRGSHLKALLPAQLGSALSELSRREGVTLFMTLLAAFQTLLFRYSGQDDLVIGSPIAGRNRAELEGLIGFFVNSLPLRTSLAGNPRFRELLTRVKKTALGAYAHQDLPFEKIVEGVQPPRSLSYPPIFQVMFALQNQPAATFSLPGLDITHLKREFDTAKFDLTLFVTEYEDELGCWLEYNTDLFEATTLGQLLIQFETLLEGIVADPNRRISELPLLKEDERQQLLVDWNNTHVDFPTKLCAHQLFESQAAKTPNATALVCGAERLTYDELNTRANKLARYLQRLGVGPEQRVGICLPRSRDMIVAVLATLKAGGAYVPLDPVYPLARLAFTLEDADACLLLTNDELAGTLPETKARKLSLDSERTLIEQEDAANAPSQVRPENLAYVIYTSGSTGMPKGVAIEHRSTVAFLFWALATFTEAELAGVLLSTSLCFDLSVFEMFAPLCMGGKVILVENALQLPGLLSGEVTLVNTVASAMTELVRINGIPNSVRTVCLAGEPLLKSLVEGIYAQSQVRQVLNLYGPSEDTTYSTYVRLAPDLVDEPSIGCPVANTSAYVLDAHLQPVPVGVPGELHLSGAGLARGYLQRPDLTAEKFVPDPFNSNAGARMYKTGDLARYQTDGTIQFLGRLDHQVKLRGYRIELGEIEAALREHPATKDTVVIVRDSPNGNRELIAYVAAADKSDLVAELRGLLKTKLPDYMVPGYFVVLDVLPLTPNGKIDRRALPSPDRTRPEFLPSRSAPRNQVEEQLAAIWKDVIELDQVGVNDDFFEVGGHSLLAVRLLAEIEKAFGQKIPLVSLFRHTTIESLAQLLSNGIDSGSWSTLVEIQKGDHRPPLFCVSMPNVNALGYKALARHLGAEQGVFGLQAQYPEDLQGEHSQMAVEQLATDYLEAIRAVAQHGPYQLVGMCRGAHIAFEMARRLREQGEEVALVGILDTWVLENTYNKFLYVEYYARRLRASLGLGLRDQLDLIRKKTGRSDAGEVAAASTANSELSNPMHAYFPGPDFQPKTYAGRVAVFRARKQPFNRVRDKSLGWATLALGGVDLHYIPGRHGADVLREPHVQVLAAEVKKCLVEKRM
ncbi:MAG: amino acid adenylation domain protein [Acidobacteria bacterium]|nr:amino acid adenylation domain protein [Acidobacteriota bacterium]